MTFTQAPLPGVVLVEPKVFGDDRGFFLETFQVERYAEHGIGLPFVQDNHSRSAHGVLRGLHAQLAKPQGKLVRVIAGEVFDVAVDMRVGSPSFGQWYGTTLSAENFRQMYVPPNFLHGFVVTSEVAEFEYKCTDYYDPGSEISVRWDDPAIGIEWPISEPVLSEKDAAAKTLAELEDRLPRFEG